MKHLVNLFWKKLWIISIIPILIIMLFTHSWGFDATVTGTEVTVSYDEPTDNEDASPLSDLDHTTIYYNMGSGGVGLNIPATQATGGGIITQRITVPIAVNQEVNVDIWATASDISGNESIPTNIKVVRIDRLTPNPPK